MAGIPRETGLGWPDDVPVPVGVVAVPAEPASLPALAEPASIPAPVPVDLDPGVDELDVAGSVGPAAVPASPPAPGGVRRRLSAAGAVVGLLLGLLGFALVVQLRSNAADSELSAARPEDLVRILSDLEAREDRLRREISALEESQRELASGVRGRQAALAEATRRADELGILAGTLPAEGPGLVVRFSPGDKPVQAAAILDAVQELRGAGAETMQIAGAGGPPVRIVASTAFVDEGGGLLVEGQRLTAPYAITVVGDAQTMRTALNIPGGVVESVGKDGGSVIVDEPGTVVVPALHQQGTLRFARPVP